MWIFLDAAEEMVEYELHCHIVVPGTVVQDSYVGVYFFDCAPLITYLFITEGSIISQQTNAIVINTHNFRGPHYKIAQNIIIIKRGNSALFFRFCFYLFHNFKF